MVLGSTETETVGGSEQSESGGTEAEQEPSHPTVPVLVWPHAFAAEMHAVPYPAGSSGAVALQIPSTIKPVLVWPHKFADEVHVAALQVESPILYGEPSEAVPANFMKPISCEPHA